MKSTRHATIVAWGIVFAGVLGTSAGNAQDALSILEGTRLAHNDLGAVALAEGNYEVARRMFARSMRDSSGLGIQDATLAVSAYGLARSLEGQGNQFAALTSYILAKSLYERLGTTTTPEYAAVLDGLATLYAVMGNASDAERLSLEAAAILKLPSRQSAARAAMQLEKSLATHIANEDYARAKEACVKAIAAEREKSSESKKVKDLTARLEMIELALVLAPRVEESIRVLEKSPQEPDASLNLGRYLCFVKQDWENGLPILQHADHQELRAAAEAELRTAPDRPLELGDLWFDLARAASNSVERKSMEGRALYWYQAAIDDVPAGVQKVKTVRRIRELSAK